MQFILYFNKHAKTKLDKDFLIFSQNKRKSFQKQPFGNLRQHHFQSFSLINLQAFTLQLYRKRNSGTLVPLRTLQTFYENFFREHIRMTASVISFAIYFFDYLHWAAFPPNNVPILNKKLSFELSLSLVSASKSAMTIAKEIHNGKLLFLCSELMQNRKTLNFVLYRKRQARD